MTFDANGGTGTMSKVTYAYGKTYSLPAATFSKKGYQFIGWSNSTSYKNVAFIDQESVKNLTPTHAGTVTLYAMWSKTSNSVFTTGCNILTLYSGMSDVITFTRTGSYSGVTILYCISIAVHRK